MCLLTQIKMEKKKYETPIFYFEQFELSQAVALSCDTTDTVTPLQADYTTCGIVIDDNGKKGIDSLDSLLFIDSVVSCKYYQYSDSDYLFAKNIVYSVDDDQYIVNYEGYCYHVPTNNHTLFGS